MNNKNVVTSLGNSYGNKKKRANIELVFPENNSEVSFAIDVAIILYRYSKILS